MKKIYSVLSVLLTIILMGVFVSCERDKEVMLTAVSVTNEQITPMYKSATISSTISSEATIRDVFVQYTVTKDFAEYDEVPMQEKDGIYTAELIDLLDNTTYYYRYAASNRHSAIVLQKIQQFATLQPTAPVIRLDSILTVWDSYAQVQVALEFDGGASVTDMGVCWGTQANPTIEDIHKSTKDTVAVLDITDLQENTKYYVRAYAVNKVGTAYSEELVFTTQSNQPPQPTETLPTVNTIVATQITATTAVTGGNVTNDGGAEVTERGVCIATISNPTTANTKILAGSGTGEFTCDITGLQEGTKYYVRAYAVNSVGTAYGEEVSFTTKVEVVDNPSSNLRTMPFSVSESKQVYFSKGNLQYHPANNVWRFAESQLDYIGGANSNCSSTYNGWLDLFGWSTKGNNFGVSTSTSSSDYSGSFVDWGTNKIDNDAPNTWRTLTYGEWNYLRHTRTNANDLVGVAQVNGVNGLILLPDNWTCPAGVTFKSGFHSNLGVDYYAAHQTFTADQWSKLESAGAVFLPAAGYRGGSGVNGVQYYGNYWSATESTSDYAQSLRFCSDEVYMYGNFRYKGLSVRLVKDLQQETVKSLPSVTTAVVTQITETTAMSGGNVTSDGGASVTERGVVYATTQNPTTNNTKLTSGTGTGSFTCNLTNLQPNTKYYVRAYAVNSKGTAYGEEVSFTTKVEVVDNPSSNLMAMPFSVSESKQVYFSKGNLQYHPANNVWRFAENQTDYIGDANSNISSTYNGWLDLFGWSTVTRNFGVSTSKSSSDYSGSFVDWGTNKIGNDAPNTWRTLTYKEWDYVVFNRPNASSLKGVAQVNGVNGLILLPDNWTFPSGVSFKSGFHSNNGDDYYAAYQTFTVADWSKLESAGAVFLPAAGIRYGSNVNNVQDIGYYWSATEKGSYYVYFLNFNSLEAYMNIIDRFIGQFVRLVKDL